MFEFRPAIKGGDARIGLIGPSGSGKTFSALRIAQGLGKRIALIDSEHGSASKYADLFKFDVLELETFDPETYVKAIKLAESKGYDVIIIDSLSHAWMGTGGALDQVDKYAQRNNNNSYAAWRFVTPKHNALVEALIRSDAHIIATMRAKMSYIIETNKGGKMQPKKVGLAPIQREGMEYEFDIIGEFKEEHRLVITKTRCHTLDGRIYEKPGPELGEHIADWLTDNAEEAAARAAEIEAATAETAALEVLPGVGKANVGKLQRGGINTVATLKERLNADPGEVENLVGEAATLQLLVQFKFNTWPTGEQFVRDRLAYLSRDAKCRGFVKKEAHRAEVVNTLVAEVGVQVGLDPEETAAKLAELGGAMPLELGSGALITAVAKLVEKREEAAA